MKTYSLFYKGSTAYLRQNNPLAGTRLVSVDAFEAHERQYIESALRFISPLQPGKTEYSETEITAVWRFRPTVNSRWEEIESEPAFIDTQPDQYELVFKLSSHPVATSFQESVSDWLIQSFGSTIANNPRERCFRFLEEAIELVQAYGMTKDEALRQLIHTYSRPPGDVQQEIGGVMVTIAGLCASAGLDMAKCGEQGLADNIARTEEIKTKFELKRKANLTGL